MIKRFLSCVILISACTALGLAENETCVIPSGRLGMLPSFTKDGKGFAYSYFYENDELNTMRFCIYDEDFQMVKDFTTILGTPNEYRYKTQEREQIPVTATLRYEDQRSEFLSINGISEGLSIESVLYELNHSDRGEWEICDLADGRKVVAASSYFKEDFFGKKYPEMFYGQVEGRWFLFKADYYAEYAPFGEWKEPVISEGIRYPGIVEIEILQKEGADQEWFELTRGIFSDDFNYVLPEYEKEEFTNEFTYEDTDRVYLKIFGYKSRIKRFKAYDSSNNVVASFELPDGYSCRDEEYLKFWRLGDKRYISVEAESSTEYVDIIYRLDENNKVTQVAIAPLAKVAPRAPRQGELVTVSFDDNLIDSPKTINVISASGQNVYKTRLPAGQSSVDLDTSQLIQGMYVVTVTVDDRSRETAKIIVR